ncbi:viral transcription factor IE2, partial [Striga asiatica]
MLPVFGEEIGKTVRTDETRKDLNGKSSTNRAQGCSRTEARCSWPRDTGEELLTTGKARANLSFVEFVVTPNTPLVFAQRFYRILKLKIFKSRNKSQSNLPLSNFMSVGKFEVPKNLDSSDLDKLKFVLELPLLIVENLIKDQEQ